MDFVQELNELKAALDKEPLPEEIKSNPDGSLYIPISITQRKLDSLFAFWNWEFQEDKIGKNYMVGKGILSVMYPNGYLVTKSGSAGVEFTREGMKLDYPRLEAMCMLNAAKKLGVAFGRNLNRDKEDMPLPVKQLKEKSEDDETDELFKAAMQLVKNAKTKDEAFGIMEANGFKYHKELKEIANTKP